MNIPKVMEARIAHYSEKLKGYPKLKQLYRNSFLQTFETALKPMADGTCFVLTGDIPAMWLRDSAAQVTHYLPLCVDEEVSSLIEGVIRRQLMYLEKDPYANAFNQEPNNRGHIYEPPKSPWVYEKKFELDSLCYPIRLLYLHWKQSGKTALIQEKLEAVAEILLDVFQKEQHHAEKSEYQFIEMKRSEKYPTAYIEPDEAVFDRGKCERQVSYTGMVRMGFRPSDDVCTYGYLTASEMFAVVILRYMEEMLKAVCNNEALAEQCAAVGREIDAGIQKYCVVEHEAYGKIYACETDGRGNYAMIDDANIPSLLSAPYIGYCDEEDEVYQNTRKFLLSKENPYYYEGTVAKGIGSPHTPEGYIWHMALVMQGLTATSKEEKRAMVEMIVNTDADTGYLHEGFHADDPTRFTRPWFTWPNALFAEFVERCIDENVL